MKELFLILFIVLQGLDIYTTTIALKNGGREINPFLSWLFERFNPTYAMIAVKSVGIGVLVWADSFYVNIACCALYIWVILNNFEVISKQKIQK